MRRAVLALALVLGATPVATQQDHVAHQHEPAPSLGWTANFDANVFFGLNLQRRHFASYDAWESQNWLMAAAERPVARGRLTFSARRGSRTLTCFTPIWANTFGYLRDLAFIPIGRLGLGGDVTFYAMRPDLAVFYEGSHSLHFFLRWRPKGPGAHHH
jgi:hypothetical protein